MSNRTLIVNDTISFGARMNDANSRIDQCLLGCIAIFMGGQV